jgi:hypothetical protein
VTLTLTLLFAYALIINLSAVKKKACWVVEHIRSCELDEVCFLLFETFESALFLTNFSCTVYSVFLYIKVYLV